MSDPLAEVIAMLNLRAVLTKTIEGAGDWRVRRSDQGLSFYGVVLEGGCRLEIDQHEPQILRAGDFILYFCSWLWWRPTGDVAESTEDPGRPGWPTSVCCTEAYELQ
ncbi:AraC family transcriptional regulator [Klebsiella pneumoniae]|nr:AraC family transcriptional regulator [Klebsiella pneumoniae]SYK50093.1 AraC family transcriptional regulator [Klebsiella pneumoniae]VAS97141.1 AraC family transcriptional regulator [Klebsiella pneumoniae]